MIIDCVSHVCVFDCIRSHICQSWEILSALEKCLLQMKQQFDDCFWLYSSLEMVMSVLLKYVKNMFSFQRTAIQLITVAKT